MLLFKITAWILFISASLYIMNMQEIKERDDASYYNQLKDDDAVLQKVKSEHYVRNNLIYPGVVLGWLLAGVILFYQEAKKVVSSLKWVGSLAIFCVLTNVGCMRPFEPVQLEVIDTSEEGFLIPLRGDKEKQTSTNSEEDLRKSLVSTKQVQIPQQWVQQGYEYFGVPNGEWRPAATLIKVDRAPVTCEWTADENSGTSNKNEAIWVMTSDQVEFSTGWTITARIASRDDAIRFLHNYPNGSLKNIMDTEIRSKLQSTFGFEVTDLPMDELRKAATPHIEKVVNGVSEFFKERGITITNMGITGGFVYKDQSIMKTMVDIFNAEQEKTKAIAKTQAQEEMNKRVLLEADGEARALMARKKAEAEGILAVAEARKKEAEVVAGNPEVYMTLRRVELEKEKLTKWNGSFPNFFMSGGDGKTPEFLLQVPDLNK